MDVVRGRRILVPAEPEQESVPVQVNGSVVQAEQPNNHLTNTGFPRRERPVGPTGTAAVDIVEDEQIVVPIAGEVPGLEDHSLSVHRSTMLVDATTCLPDIEAEPRDLRIVTQRP